MEQNGDYAQVILGLSETAPWITADNAIEFVDWILEAAPRELGSWQASKLFHALTGVEQITAPQALIDLVVSVVQLRFDHEPSRQCNPAMLFKAATAMDARWTGSPPEDAYAWSEVKTDIPSRFVSSYYSSFLPSCLGSKPSLSPTLSKRGQCAERPLPSCLESRAWSARCLCRTYPASGLAVLNH